VTEPKYLEQWERVKRWYQRFGEISQGKLHDRPSDFYQDEVYAFFMNCYHLKDWIKNNPTNLSLSDKVENFISNTLEMALCADICNSMKHLRLSKPKRSEYLQFGNRHFEVGLGTQPTTVAVKYSIDTVSGAIDAYELATQCMKAWEGFFKKL
jgi:hypothetical protein